MLLFIVIETISDQQQYNFQTKKYRKIKNGKELKGDYKEDLLAQDCGQYPVILTLLVNN